MSRLGAPAMSRKRYKKARKAAVVFVIGTQPRAQAYRTLRAAGFNKEARKLWDSMSHGEKLAADLQLRRLPRSGDAR